MKSAGKARNNGLYRHIRTSKEIIRNLLNDYPKYIYYFLKCTLKVDGKDKSTVPGVDRNVLHALKVSYFSDKDYQIEIAR